MGISAARAYFREALDTLVKHEEIANDAVMASEDTRATKACAQGAQAMLVVSRDGTIADASVAVEELTALERVRLRGRDATDVLRAARLEVRSVVRFCDRTCGWFVGRAEGMHDRNA